MDLCLERFVKISLSIWDDFWRDLDRRGGKQTGRKARKQAGRQTGMTAVKNVAWRMDT